jgi:plastocyanin
MKKLAVLLALALAATALVACGDDDGTTTTDTGAETTGAAAEGEKEAGGGGEGGGLTVKFEADPEGGLAYTSTEETAEAGNVTIDLINPQALAHDVAIEDSNGEQIGKTDVITEGEDSATVKLEPGKYTFYCTVPGHREAGMEGTLTVE